MNGHVHDEIAVACAQAHVALAAHVGNMVPVLQHPAKHPAQLCRSDEAPSLYHGAETVGGE